MSIPAALVTGDVALDSHLYGGIKTEATSHREPGTREISTLGGACLCRKILDNASDPSGIAWEKAQQSSPSNTARPPKPYTTHLSFDDCSLKAGLPDNHHSYGVWTRHPSTRDAKQDDTGVWRVETHFGYGSHGRPIEPVRIFPPSGSLTDGRPSVILVDDGGILFRQTAELWPKWSQVQTDGLIVLKMGSPICRGDLWQALRQSVPRQLLVVVSADDLRREDARIRKNLSWEQSAADTYSALRRHPLAKELLDAAHIIVNFSSDGALWLHREADTEDHVAELIFDPTGLEGDHARNYEGSVYGFQTCLTASIAHHFMMAVAAAADGSHRHKAICSGIIAGLKARRRLLEVGHGRVGQDEPGFPLVEIGKVIAESAGDYVRVPVPPGETLPSSWSILADSERSGAAVKSLDSPLFGLGQLTAIYGKGALSHVPTFEKGDLFTADRSEIESLRTLERLMREYEGEKKQKKPLSIGVFGPPGAGKSFSVQMLAKAILGKDAPFLEFNLSQFKDPIELIGALHRVRDEVLKGSTPVAFWDEFDSQGYRWLQYLLAPMQDGAFQEGQLTHPIGKCVFIFAGGTADSIEQFGVPEPPYLGTAERAELKAEVREDRIGAERAYREFKLLKGPDFISRLHGYLNVLGPNPREGSATPDLTWPIRRALFLRSKFGLKKSELLDMDTGLLIALLRTLKYRHGSRSFEKILLTINQGRQAGHFHRSSLPPDSLLARELDVEEFHKFMDEYNDFKTNADIEKLAAAIHERYRTNAAANHWSINPAIDKPYGELAPDSQVSNRNAARRIPDLLALISLRVVPNARSGDRSWEVELKSRIKLHRERLAQAEHLGWMAERIANGWSFAPKRQDAQKQHNLLVDWARLSESDKNKDRENMDAIPEWLELAGYKTEELHNSSSKASQ